MATSAITEPLPFKLIARSNIQSKLAFSQPNTNTFQCHSHKRGLETIFRGVPKTVFNRCEDIFMPFFNVAFRHALCELVTT